MNASGCGVMVKDYGHLLEADPVYANKAARISSLTQDLSEVIAPKADPLARLLVGQNLPALVFHPPCTLQHGQKLLGVVESTMAHLGFAIRVAAQDAHLCGGSAGRYSVLHAELSYQLRDRKLSALAI